MDKSLRLVARIISSLVIAFLLFMLIGETAGRMQAKEKVTFPSELLWFIAFVGLAVVGYVISWFSELIGGVLLIVCGVAVAIYFLFFIKAGFMMALQFGPAFIIPGWLFIKSRKPVVNNQSN